MPARPEANPSPSIVALAGWLLPGAGYWLIGQRARGLVVGGTILTLFMLGVLIAGIRVIEVPGYDQRGAHIRTDRLGRRLTLTDRGWENGRWVLLGASGVLGEVADKPWFVPQVATGPTALIAAALSVSAAQRGVPRVHARLADISTLYTAIAGMLNLMAIIDSAHRAAHPQTQERIDEGGSRMARSVA